MKLLNLFLAITISCTLLSCGGETASETASASSNEEVPKDLDEAINKSAKAIEDLFKGNGEDVEIVNWRELKEFLPNKVNGLALNGDIDGQTSKMFGFQFSSVEASYKDGSERIEIKVIDCGNAGSIVKMFASWADGNIESDTSDGYAKSTEYRGHRAFETYEDKTEKGSFSVLVNDRFVIVSEGRQVKMGDLKKAMDDISFRKIEKL